MFVLIWGTWIENDPFNLPTYPSSQGYHSGVFMCYMSYFFVLLETFYECISGQISVYYKPTHPDSSGTFTYFVSCSEKEH